MAISHSGTGHATADAIQAIQVHPAGSSAPELADGNGGFDRSWFMGEWSVAWSTLPMWKNRRDVTITYIPTSATGDRFETFDSDVAYRNRNAARDAAFSHVTGVETLRPNTNGATFDWHGKGWLRFVYSHWEVIGCGVTSDGVEWCATAFSKTLFTPAGLDLYLRASNNSTLSEDRRASVVDRIVPLIKIVEGTVGELALAGFPVP